MGKIVNFLYILYNFFNHLKNNHYNCFDYTWGYFEISKKVFSVSNETWTRITGAFCMFLFAHQNFPICHSFYHFPHVGRYRWYVYLLSVICFTFNDSIFLSRLTDFKATDSAFVVSIFFPRISKRDS